jgi:DNA polymerase
MHVELASPTDVAGFRAQSTRMLAGQIAPEQIDWHAAAMQAFASPVSSADSRPGTGRRSATPIVPLSFMRLTELVVLHHDEDRFALLYRLLWRLVHEPKLRNGGHDADMAHAVSMAHAVRRELYKMKVSLRLRHIGSLAGEPLQFAWHEPVHHVVEEVGSWLAKNFGDGCWFIATPERCMMCRHGRLLCGPGIDAEHRPAPDDDAGWLEVARGFAAAAGPC